MQTITPFLWFDNNAEEAMKFYAGIFKDSKVGNVSRLPDGSVMSAEFTLLGQPFMALNGGPQFKFTEAVSFFISCDTQQEVDGLWEKLCKGGMEQPCGWVKDRFGLSWQVVPKALGELLGDEDPAKSQRVLNAMLQMKKIDIKGLQRAHAG